MSINTRRLLRQLAERLREIATRQGNVPFKTGDLRKSIIVAEVTDQQALVGSNLPYARAVHDGRPALTIRPKKKRALFWPGAAHPVRVVHQPARKGNPFLVRALQQLAADPLPPEIRADFGDEVADQIEAQLRRVANSNMVIRRSRG